MISTIFIFAVVFTIIALVHEGGHYFAAKKAGIRVIECGLGFGPKLWSKKIKDTTYAINAFPILAYVRIAGEELEQDEKDEEFTPEDQKYYNKSVWSKFWVAFSGPAMNILVSVIVLSIMFIFAGVPKEVSNVIDKVSPNSPAEQIGLKSGDKIIALNGKTIIKMEDTIEYIHKNYDKPVSLKIERNGTVITKQVTPKYDKKMKVGLIGFSPRPQYIKVNPLKAIYYGFEQTFGMIVLMFVILGKLIVGGLSFGDLAGPVGIAQITGKYAETGLLSFLNFFAFLNVNIGVMNLLPLPALDGGRLIFIFIEGIRKKAVDAKLESKIHTLGMYALLALMFVITINDILRIIRAR